MSKFEELIAKYETVKPDSKKEEFGKLGIIEKLVEIKDVRVLPFFLKVLADETEYDLARVEIAKILEFWETEDKKERRQIAQTLIEVMKGSDDEELVQQWTGYALCHYSEVEGVYDFASDFILHTDKDINSRFNIIVIFERDGPTEKTLNVFRNLLNDEEFNKTATRILKEWGQEI